MAKFFLDPLEPIKKNTWLLTHRLVVENNLSDWLFHSDKTLYSNSITEPIVYYACKKEPLNKICHSRRSRHYWIFNVEPCKERSLQIWQVANSPLVLDE